MKSELKTSKMHLSKSKYCGIWQCPKIAWMKQYKPEESVTDGSLIARMETGQEVGNLARGLFDSYTDVTSFSNGRLDIGTMLLKTKVEMEAGSTVICEAAFEHEGLYCAVDILVKEENGWAIYEVKSSTHDDIPVYIADAAYQKHVLTCCGVEVTGTYLVCLNGEYVFNGILDIQELFKITDISEAVSMEKGSLAGNIEKAQHILDSSEEPAIDLSINCNKPYPCTFWKYCSRHLPRPSVFDLYRMPFKKKIEYYKDEVISYDDLQQFGNIRNEKQLRQIQYYLEKKEPHIEKDRIREFLQGLSYPIYFLDFETMQPAVPLFKGTKPYAQIPFQYSLHYIEHEGGELKHREFLAESGTDPRRALAEQICDDIPIDACVTAYNKAFECTRLKELAATYLDLEEHLLSIEANIVDLLVPFRSGYYYDRAMGGSFSIKSVLPAIFPNDPSLNYSNLEGVHNGSEAMTLFPKIKDLPLKEQIKARNNLLKYCELDTYAMVRLWQELVRVANEL